MTEQATQPEAFIQFNTDSNARDLHPLIVLARQGPSWTVSAFESNLPIEADQEVTFFFEHRNEFMQQAVRIKVVHGDADGCEFEVEMLGEPFSAENRQCYRVVTISADCWLQVVSDGVESENCQIVDVSATGCAVISHQKFERGQIVAAEMTHDQTEYCGSLKVQSVIELTKGRIRYGTHCMESADRTQNLGIGLRLISMEVQRAQLRRLSGAA